MLLTAVISCSLSFLIWNGLDARLSVELSPSLINVQDIFHVHSPAFIYPWYCQAQVQTLKAKSPIKSYRNFVLRWYYYLGVLLSYISLIFFLFSLPGPFLETIDQVSLGPYSTTKLILTKSNAITLGFGMDSSIISFFVYNFGYSYAYVSVGNFANILVFTWAYVNYSGS